MIAVSNGRPIAAMDATWLRMDRPKNLMVIESVMWFDTPVDWDRLVGVVGRRMVARYPVFRQRPIESWIPLGPPAGRTTRTSGWTGTSSGPRSSAGRTGDKAALERYVEQQMHRPFRRDHPLWEMHFVDGVGSGSALVVRCTTPSPTGSR